MVCWKAVQVVDRWVTGEGTNQQLQNMGVALWLPSVPTLKLQSVYALINASPSRYARRLRRLSYDSDLLVPWPLLSRRRHNAP